jgi:RimJ/RimL family protein N-acetyltransferase
VSGEHDVLTTARMRGERLRLEHEPELLTLLRDPRVARTLTDDGQVPDRSAVRARLAWGVEHWERFAFGLWVLRDRETGELAGRGGLQTTFATGRDEIEAAWTIVPERWGQGLATELALAVVEMGLGPIGLESIIAYTTPDNVASQRVMEKSGFRYEREFLRSGRTMVLFRRRRW